MAQERSSGGPRRIITDARGQELKEKVVHINRVAKVVKGGRRFGFAALVVVGDSKGRAGYGAGKAREVPEAIRKATEQARRGMIRVPLREGRTLHHDIQNSYGAGRVIVRAAKPGTGIIAGGPMRAIFEALGVQDVVAKSVGSSNPHNMIKATFAALGDKRVSALLVNTDPYFLERCDQFVALATYSVPTIYPWREAVTAGGLMSYGASLADGYRQVGIYASRILKGEKPADLPVVQPTKFELAINLKTAKALGLQIPDRLLALADEVIE